MGFYRAGYEGPYDPFPHHWFCTQCGTKFHEDDPRILHPDGDFCSRRCLALWCAELLCALVCRGERGGGVTG